ncbi:OmpA family protein, partial [Psychrilyobacter atlanticus]|uniref:OmpA family protein n=1 Tax=Psychrilyobacter atlanticus TaxID=271091 RepID=UPI00146CB37E
IDNMATVSYGGTTKDSNITKTAIESATAKTNLLVEKTVTDANTNDIAEADEKLTYAIKVTNNSSVKVVGAVLTDLLDSKFFDGQTAPNLVGATGNIKTGVTLPEIEAGKSVTVSFELKAIYPLNTVPGETIDNMATVSYGGTTKDSNKVSLPIQKLVATDLDIKLQVEDLGGNGFERGDGIVDDGEEAEYTISITNPTPVNAVNVLVSDDYKGLYLYKNDSYKYVSSDGKKLTGKDLKEGIVLPEIKAGETIELKFMVGFSYEGKNVDQDDTIPNEAYLSLQETSPLKKLMRAATPINKSSNKVVLNVANPTYTLSKEIRNKKDEFYPGDIVVYDITLENTSKVIGRNIKVEDKVSEIKAFESWTWESGISKTPESLLKTSLRKDLSENGIELLAGETKRYTVVGRLKDTLSKGEVKNTVKAGENLELQAEATLKVTDAQIKVTKTAKKKWVSIGDLISYKITVQNLSGNKGTVLKNLSLKDMMPPGFKYAEGSGKVDGNDADEDLRGRTIYFNNLELVGDKKIEITYILRIGTGVKPGSYKNKAWIENTSGKNLSNIGEASVEVINDPLFNSTVIIGKVFHDRDNDGWQDDANAYDIRVQTLSSQDNYLDGSVKKGEEEWRISSESKELLLGNLDGRGDESERSQKVILRRRIKDPKKIGDILIKSKEGSNITLKSTGEVLRNHSGNRNLTGVDLKVVRRVIKDPKYREELKNVKSLKKVRIENFIEPIYFDSAYANIRDGENEKLKQYLEKLSNKKNLKLVIVGYTDSQKPSKKATFKNNHELSIARANTLKDYLSMKLDLSEEMFVIEGKGPKNPKGSNRTSSGRQLNRRTEIVIEYDEEIMKQIPLKVDESDYFEEVEIRNDGISEEGIPGVRLATVEGLVIETDQFGRYHVDGIDDIPDRGKNFIIKVDKVTLPSGTEFTTENPRVKTLTKVMEKFNFGVKIPKVKRRVKEKEIKVRVGSVFFLTDKWNVREDQIDNLKKISSLLTEYRGGVIVVEGNTDSRASNKYNEILALKRAKSIGKELEKIMGKDMISNVKIVTDLSGGER